jgi:asparagine synthase (glutamine-hydrolysing)
MTKKLLKRLCLRYLPESIVFRPKQGFGVPDRCWSQERLLNLADDLLFGTSSQLLGFVDPRRLREHLTRMRDPGQFHVYQVWEILVLEQWLRKAVEQTRAVPAAA